VAGHQQITQEWWANQRDKFELFVSQTVLEEIAGGDQEAAQQRLSVIESLPLQEITEEAIALAKDLVRLGPLPEKAAVDALHIAIAVTNKVDYLLTWNCKHLANAALRSRIERVCRARGYDPVVICTPEELLED
jgi:predicted nucleic acid-binding protein